MIRGISARAVRNFFIVATPGLERSLERELQVLGIPGRLETTPGGVFASGSNETLWRVVLQSRVAEAVRMRLGDPFHAPDVRSLDKRLQSLPWEDCLALDRTAQGAPTLDPLEVKATSDKSRIYHTGLIEERVAVAIEKRHSSVQASTLQTKLDKKEENSLAITPLEADGSTSADPPVLRRPPAPAEVRVHIRHDECHVSIGASGPLHQRGYRTALGEAPLRETLAAACVLASPLLRRLTVAAHMGEELVFWDPFCGSGTLLLEALGVALGQPPGNRTKKYPFASFPCHNKRKHRECVQSLEPTPHPSLSRLKLLGSDRSVEQLELAQRNLRRLVRRLPRPRQQQQQQLQLPPGDAAAGANDLSDPGGENAMEGDVAVGAGDALDTGLPCDISFLEGSPAKIVQSLAGRPTMILTNVPYGILSGGKTSSKSGRTEALDAYSQLGRMLRQRKADWKEVLCLVGDVEAFTEHTGLEWESELRFLSGGRWVDLLRWTGQQGSAQPSRSRHSSDHDGDRHGSGSHGAGRSGSGRR